MVFNSFSISLSFSDPLSPMSPLQAECMPQRKQITAPSAENISAVKNLCELCNLFFGIRYRVLKPLRHVTMGAEFSVLNKRAQSQNGVAFNRCTDIFLRWRKEVNRTRRKSLQIWTHWVIFLPSGYFTRWGSSKYEEKGLSSHGEFRATNRIKKPKEYF